MLTTAQLFSLMMAVLLVGALSEPALAQFGTVGGAGGAAVAHFAFSGPAAWILSKQAEFYQQLARLMRASRNDGSAAWTLYGLSFLYGIFHAAGPGHGKAVISSYLVASEETWRRGVVLSLVSALLQAIVAILLVAVLGLLLHATAFRMSSTSALIENASYLLIVGVGARLLWVKSWAFLAAVRDGSSSTVLSGGARHRHDDHMSGGVHVHHHHEDVCHDHRGHGGSLWRHAHAPEPALLGGRGGWRHGMGAVVAVGVRPCSGAVIVLVFAMAQQIFWVGAAATMLMGLGTFLTVVAIASVAVWARGWASTLARSHGGKGLIAMRAIEVAAACIILALGGLLLAGLIIDERMPGM